MMGKSKLRQRRRAGVAQLVEHLTCNERVAGSIPVAGSSFFYYFATFVRASFS